MDLNTVIESLLLERLQIEYAIKKLERLERQQAKRRIPLRQLIGLTPGAEIPAQTRNGRAGPARS